MKIKYRNLNENETYCCNKEEVKKIFGNADINVYFGTTGQSRSEDKNNIIYAPYKGCEDRILARINVFKKRIVSISSFSYEAVPSLKIYIIRKFGYSSEMQKKFHEEVLPKIYDFYLNHKDDDDLQNYGKYTLTIGLNNETFNFYEKFEIDRNIR